MSVKRLALSLAAMSLAVPITAAHAQMDGPPRRAKPRPPAPAPVYTPPAAPTQPLATPAPAPAASSGFDLPPPPPASSPPPAPVVATPAEPPFRLGRGDQVLRWRSDTPGVAITAITFDGQTAQTRGLGTGLVETVLKADPDEGDGTPCDTDGMEARLSNGVIWLPATNFCNSQNLITVPAARAPLPRPLPTAPREFAWQYAARGMDATLAYGIPESDATAFLATCRKASGRIELKFVAEAGTNPRADIYAQDTVWRLDLVSNQPQSEEEPRTNAMEMFARDSFWVQLRQGLRLPYRVGAGPFLMLDTSTGQARIGQFVTFCSTR